MAYVILDEEKHEVKSGKLDLHSKNITEINYHKEFASDKDLISGDAESYGIENELNFTNNMMHLSVGYTLAYSYKTVNNWTYYPRYDSRHSINCAIEVNIGSGWKTMLTWTYKSGLPYTPIIGYYDKLFFNSGELIQIYLIIICLIQY